MKAAGILIYISRSFIEQFFMKMFTFTAFLTLLIFLVPIIYSFKMIHFIEKKTFFLDFHTF